MKATSAKKPGTANGGNQK